MYVINLIEDALGKKAVIKYAPRHPADVVATWAHIEKAKEKLKWRPKISIEDGLKQTVQWYLDNREFLNSLRSS
jgi:UDP-glucuronate 4-epimerase